MRIIFKCSLIIMLLSCCSASSDKDYIKLLNFFGDSLTSHFPTSETENMSQQLDTFCYHNTLSLYVTKLNIPKVRIDSLITSYTSKSIGLYSSDDSCLLVINDYINIKNIGDRFIGEKSVFIEGCSNNKIPVLNFWFDEMATEETRCRLPKDFMIYVLEFKKGNYSRKIDVELSSMPDNIKHGYSRGVAISKQRVAIIYWLVIW